MHRSHTGYCTFVELLRARAVEHPDRRAFTFLADGEQDEQLVTYADLDRRARAVAAKLQATGEAGQRVLLLYPPGMDYVSALLGCLYAGAVAVPAYPPRPNRSVQRIRAILADAQATIALTANSQQVQLDRMLAAAPDLAAVCWLSTDSVEDAWADQWQTPEIHGATLAFLQYTSGSTGTPKGVMVTHGNLLHNEKFIKQTFQHTEESVVVGWLPLYHDMGLIGNVLQTLYTGLQCVMMPPVAFLQKPLRWLEAITKYRGTTCGGPNFAYDLCVNEISPDERAGLDLSSWDLAYNGAEPVRADTMERFARAYAPHGFRREAFFPCYGMAEATLMISGGDKQAPFVTRRVSATALEQDRAVADQGENGESRDLVGCGQCGDGHEVVIVDPESLTRCRNNQVGEIWVAGPSVTAGYWGRPEETDETFRACLADTGEGPFLRTGDLGFLSDGELFVTGRLKDLIIIRGANHYPQDIEQTAEQSHPALRPGCGAAFSVDIMGEERLIIAHEVRRTHLRKLNVEDVVGAIRTAVSQRHDLVVEAVLLLKTGSLPRTSSGKSQRHACRDGFLHGGLKVVGRWSQSGDVRGSNGAAKTRSDGPALCLRTGRSAEAIQAWLVTKVAERLKIAPHQVDVRQPFVAYGLDSVAAVSLAYSLQEELGRPLSPTLVYDYPTIAILAEHLADQHRVSSGPSSREGREFGQREPIAVIGMGCRFPGAPSPRAFWELISRGQDAITELPSERREAAGYGGINPVTGEPMTKLRGGFLENVDQFDASFFGISPREAEAMDPQQRLLLEVTWEALEYAGVAPDHLAGSQTGVFVGISTGDYSRLLWPDHGDGNAYAGTGNALSIAANRLSYVLDLHGPSWAVDTACSSSLVAVHQACRSLREGECNLALAGGVNLILASDLTVTFSRAGLMAPDGRCKTFDDDADGYVRGEGCGIVVLKRLSDAVRDGDTILAILRGTAVNQDGRSNGLTAPNGPSQQAVVRAALDDARVRSAELSYVEAHGTGTSLGDPIEMNSLKEVLMAGRGQSQPCWVGSVKTNIGHLEAAAGIASLMKVVLSIQHAEIPPLLHLKKLNRHIKLDDTPISIPTECVPWPSGKGRRLAGVSSFGFGGTNAHVIVEEPPAVEPARDNDGPRRPVQVLTLSAKTPAALDRLGDRYRQYLDESPNNRWEDLCATSHTGRTHFPHRLAVVAGSAEEARHRLEKFFERGKASGVFFDRVVGNTSRSVAFMFTGQGSQYVNMARALYQTQPTFRAALDRCDEILRPLVEQPLLTVLYPDDAGSSPLNQTAFAQPALFAMEYALVELWKSWGVKPAAVMGHSLGEYVAACVAGVFSLEDGLTLTAARARMMQALPGEGRMVAILAEPSRVADAIRPYAQEVSMAAVNGPQQVVISGRRAPVDAIVTALEREGVPVRDMAVSHAFHSPLVEPMLDEFEELCRKVDFREPSIRFVSNLYGGLVQEEIATPEYWCRHLREPVRFAAGMAALDELGCKVFLEIGPKPILVGLGQQCLSRSGRLWLPSLRENRDDWTQLLESLGQLFARGVPIDWHGFDRAYRRRKVVLPTYPFQRQPYWVQKEPTSGGSYSNSPGRRQVHPLLGFRIVSAGKEVVFEGSLSADRPGYLGDHRVCDTPILPFSAYLEMARAAGASVLNLDNPTVEELTVQQALPLSSQRTQAVQVVLAPEQPGTYGFQIFSRAEEEGDREPSWIQHASGKVSAAVQSHVPAPTDLDGLKAQCRERVAVEDHYRRCAEWGINYGPTFQGIAGLWRGDGDALGEIRLPDNLVGQSLDYYLHPALLDACFQVLVGAVADDGPQQDVTYLPVGLKRFRIFRRPGLGVCSHVRVDRPVQPSPQSFVADVALFGPKGEPIAVAEGLQIARASRGGVLGKPDSIEQMLYEVAWRPQVRAGRTAPPDFLADPAEVQRHLEPRAAELSGEAVLSRYGCVLRELEKVSVQFVLETFRELGCELRTGRSFQTAAMAQELGVVEAHRRLFRRLLEILSEEGVLDSRDDLWEVVREPAVASPAEHCRKALKEYPEAEAEFALLSRCGSRLADVLRGKCDPLDLLFPGGDVTPVARLYQDSPGARAMNILVRDAVKSAIGAIPPGRGVRVLEVGAGTGGTTSYLLPVLPPQRTEYVFTDVSQLLVAKAKEKFREFPFVCYRTLDVEKSPDSQGFEPHRFDVVVAANVLHATRDLRETVENIKQTLAPGGILVLLEGTAPQRWLDLIFGLTEGWWRFADVALRPSYPLLSSARWQSLLADCGFAPSSSVALQLSGGADPAAQAVIISQNRGAKTSEAENEHGSWLILSDRGGTGQQLAEGLRSRGEACTLAFAGDAYRPVGDGSFEIDANRAEDYHRLLAALERAGQPPLRGVVHLWPLEVPQTDAPAAGEAMAASQRVCGSALHLIQSLVETKLPRQPRLWLVTEGAQPVQPTDKVPGVAQAPLWGMGKVVALEHPELSCVRVDLDPDARQDMAQALLDEIWAGSEEDQVAFRDGTRYVARLARYGRSEASGSQQLLPLPDGRPYRLAIANRGTLENLRLEAMRRRRPGPGEVEIQVHATGLNFIDVLDALGLLPFQRTDGLGGECAGQIVAVGDGVEGLAVGDAVVAIAPGAFGQYVTLSADGVVRKPDKLSFEEAATVPVAFLTAYHALCEVGGMRSGQRVLIHAAAGGVGLAAVQLARQAGAEVFATASRGKWAALHEIGVEHVMDSRTLDFADQVMQLTDGKGVDLVLNCLAGEFIPKSLSVLAPGGRFLEIGKTGVWNDEQVAKVRPDVRYAFIDLLSLSKQQPEYVQDALRYLMEQFCSGALRPLPRTVFRIRDSIAAFRYMQKAAHVGKIVVAAADEETASQQPVRFSEDATYLITGGLGGLGILVARWMVERGARHLALIGRTAPSREASDAIQALEKEGAVVRVLAADVSEEEAFARAIRDIEETLPPVHGVIHAAGVLQDATLRQQSWERFAHVLGPKVAGACILHRLTRSMPLDFFVLFSSAASLFGSPGQANHAAANALLDALAFARRAQGLPGLSINWGAWSEVGAAARKNVGGRAASMGMGTIRPEDGLKVLERLMQQAPVQTGVVPLDWSQIARQGITSPFLEDFAQAAIEDEPQREAILGQLEAAAVHERRALVVAYVQAQVARVLGLNPSEPIDTTQGFFELGMDSLTAVELRNRLQSAFGADLPSTAMFNYPNIEALADYFCQEVLPFDFSDHATLNKETVHRQETPHPTDLEDLSADQLGSLLGEKLAKIEEALE